MINKKGSIDDKIYVLVAFITVIIGFTGWALFYTPTYDTLTGLNSTSANAALANVTPNAVFGWMDWILVCFYFAINILVCIILPLYVEHNPIYIVLLFLFSFGFAYGVAVLSNVMVDFLISVSTPFSHTMFLLNNLLVLEIVFLLLMSLVLFYKFRSVGGSQYYQ